MEEKRKLKKKKIRIEDDLTWMERCSGNLKGIAWEEQRKEARIWVKYGKVRVD